MTLPMLPGFLVFGTAIGAAAAAKGMSLIEVLSMSAFVYAGAAQFVALQQWSSPFTFVEFLAVLISVATVNARMILMGATLRPWLAPLGPVRVYPMLYLLTDANWLIGSRYHATGGRDVGVFLGSGLALWAFWVAATAPGFIAGALLSDPKQFGLDLVMPIIFVIMGAAMWRGRSDLPPWLVAGAVSLGVWLLVPGYWYIVAGALSGALAAAILPPGQDKAPENASS